MDGKVLLFKSLAVVSALSIGGGYVGWRQLEANKVKERERNEQAKAEDEDRLLLSGSKSYTGGTLLKEGDLTDGILPPLEEGDGADAPLLPGSKSISMPLFKTEEIKQLQSEGKGTERLEVIPQDLLPSSKIGILRLREKEADPPEEKAPKLLPGSKSGSIFIPEKPEAEKSE